MTPLPEPFNYNEVQIGNKHNRKIRLLRIQPGNGQDVKCTLAIANLEVDPPPVYRALSYTWGSPTPEPETVEFCKCKDTYCARHKHILCNDRVLRVTDNLFDCLQQFSQQEAFCNVDFWVDAVCINQEDESEQGHQVSMMGDIYTRAEEVVVWLGKADDSTPLACDLIRALGALSKKENIQLSQCRVPSDGGDEAKPPQREHWIALAALFNRNWFTRVWVVQEVVMAKQVTTLCGNFHVDWDDIAAASDVLSKNHVRELASGVKYSSHKNATFVKAIKRDVDRGFENRLLYALIRCRNLNSTIDHDKLYGLLGIHFANGQLGGKIPEGSPLYPDYSQTPAEAYTKIAKYLIEKGDDLTVLTICEGEDFQKTPGLPSWAPDWHTKGLTGFGITGYRRFEASKGLIYAKPTFHDGNRMSLQAAQLSPVVQIGETKQKVYDGQLPMGWLLILCHMEHEYPIPSSSGRTHDRLEAFWRTLITDTASNGTLGVQVDLKDGFLGWLQNHIRNGLQRTNQNSIDSLWKCMDRLAQHDPSIRAIQTALQSSDGQPVEPNPEEVTKYDNRYTHGMFVRPFRAGSGYLGLGSSSMRAGDSVWIVPGCRVPLIFRRSGNSRFRLVGGAYVHGLMAGVPEKVTNGLEFRNVQLE